MEPYAVEFWHDHLKEAAQDLMDMSSSEKQEIGLLLTKLLQDKSTIITWVDGRDLQ
jgi:hypothetical protein